MDSIYGKYCERGGRPVFKPEDQENLPKKKLQLITVKEWVDENYVSKITLDQLSAQFFINKYYLSKSFKEQFGQSLSSYILSVRMQS